MAVSMAKDRERRGDKEMILGACLVDVERLFVRKVTGSAPADSFGCLVYSILVWEATKVYVSSLSGRDCYFLIVEGQQF